MRESWLLAGCVCDGVCQCHGELLLEGWAWVVVTRCRWCKSRCLVELCCVTWFLWLPWLCVGARTGQGRWVWFPSSWCGGLVLESVWWWLIYRGVLDSCRSVAPCLSDVYSSSPGKHNLYPSRPDLSRCLKLIFQRWCIFVIALYMYLGTCCFCYHCKLFVFMFLSVSAPWAPSRVDMCALQILIIIIIIIIIIPPALLKPQHHQQSSILFETSRPQRLWKEPTLLTWLYPQVY